MGNLVINAIGNATTAAHTETVLRLGEEGFAFTPPFGVIPTIVGIGPTLVGFCFAALLAGA
jgi:hypothetical protein